MKAQQGKFAEQFLGGFIPAGLLLLVATWLITGEKSVALGFVPFAMLVWIWFGLRSAKDGEGQNNAG